LRVPSTGAGKAGSVIETPEGPLRGDALLAAVSDAMIALHERYYHRRPGVTTTRLLGEDLLACVMGGVYTDVEKTLIELDRSHQVRDSRSAFQRAMEHRFTEAVERLSGRTVLTFISTHHVGPDMEVELFFLDAPVAASTTP
jgi:uncharacterized protein YbcI